jgi:hypothetical protein
MSWKIRIDPDRAVRIGILWCYWGMFLLITALVRQDLNPTLGEVFVLLILFPAPLFVLYAAGCLIAAVVKMLWLSRTCPPSSPWSLHRADDVRVCRSLPKVERQYH